MIGESHIQQRSFICPVMTRPGKNNERIKEGRTMVLVADDISREIRAGGIFILFLLAASLL